MECLHCQTPIPDSSRFCMACGADVSDPSAAPTSTGTSPDFTARLGRLMEGRYRLKEALGRGGMGAVFLAEDLTLERPVAIKVLPPELSHDENLVRRFEREARTAAKLDHPNIIPIFSVQSEEGMYYFVMKYVSGRSLEGILKEHIPPLQDCQRILWESACALGHAHQRGVVHRDIKPANIMIDHDGRTVLTDFGISKAVQAATQFTGTGQIIGTPHYMSPEQAKGLEVDGRSDQYSLAVLGYRMLTGELPFGGDSVHTILYKHIFEDPQPPHAIRPDLPRFLSTALQRAMAKSPDERFAFMEEFATAIRPDHPVAAPSGTGARSLAARRPSTSEAPTEITSPTRQEGRRIKTVRPAAVRWPVALSMVLLGGVGGVFLLQLSGGGSGDVAMQPASVPVEAGSPQPGVPTPADTQQGGAALTAGAQTVDTAARVAEKPPPRREPPRRQQPRPQPQRPAPAPAAGWLTINADPYGRVSVNGVDVDDTPLIRHELRPGRYVVQISRAGYRTWTDTIVITAGNQVRRNIPLVKENQ